MSAPLTVVITDFLEEAEVETPILGDLARIVVARAQDEESLRAVVGEADAMILFHEIARMGEATFSAAPRCKCVVRAGVGYNNVDLAAAGRHGIAVCNVPDYGTEEVADHAIMFLLAVARKLIPCHEAIRAGTWHYESAVGAPRLRGKVLGLVGCGRIGTATAASLPKSAKLGLDVVFHDPLVKHGTRQGALGIRRAPFARGACSLRATS